jgi:hypothetical protein
MRGLAPGWSRVQDEARCLRLHQESTSWIPENVGELGCSSAAQLWADGDFFKAAEALQPQGRRAGSGDIWLLQMWQG